MLSRARRDGPWRARFWHRLATLEVAFRYLRARLAGRGFDSPSRHQRRPHSPPHGESFMQSVLQDVVYGLRTLRGHPGTSVVVVLMLAVGIGANIAAFTLVEAALLRPLPYPEPGRLVLGQTTFDGNVNPSGSAHDWDDYRTRNDSFSGLAAVSNFAPAVTVVAGAEAERVTEAHVSHDLFPTLGVDPVRGRVFTAEESVEGGPQVVMVSHEFWQSRLGGSPDAVGEAIRVDGRAHTVVGVMPRGFHFLWDAHLWRPLRLGSGFAAARRFHNWLMVGRLRPEVQLERAQADVDAISRQLQEEYPDSNEGKALRLLPLDAAMRGAVARPLLLLMATAVLVLLVACANVASLLLARGAARETELAVRAALGADRGRIARQLLTESVVLGLLAGSVGVALAVWLRGALLRVVPLGVLGIERLESGSGVLLFAVGASLIASVIFGMAPALRVAPRQPSAWLAGSRTSTGGGHRLRSALVIGQVAIAVVLLVGAGLLLRSFARLSSQDPGFETARLLTAEIDISVGGYDTAQARLGFFRSLAERLQALPEVEGVALVSRLPIRDPGNNVSIRDADAADDVGGPLAYQRTVLPGYFSVMGMPLLAGRDLEPADAEPGTVSLVVSRSLTRSLFEGSDAPREALGRRVLLDWGEPVPAIIVGVVEDVRLSGLAGGGGPAFYSHFGSRASSTMRLAVRTRGEPESIVGPLRDVLRQLDPAIPLAGVSTMTGVISDSVAGQRLISVSLALFSGLALFLAVIGLYGVLAQTVVERRREIGLRVALGAGSADVVGMVVRRGMLLVGIGLAIGLPAALAGGRALQSLLFQLGSGDPVTLFAVPVLLALVGLTACLVPALRAVRVDPVISLRVD